MPFDGFINSNRYKNWGWACERVQAVDVVTAEGHLLHCNASQNEDLYWAARGAGPGQCIFALQYRKSRW